MPRITDFCIVYMYLNAGQLLLLLFLLSSSSHCSGDKIEKNEMGGACSVYGGEERRIQGFGGETERKENTWEAQA